MHWFKRNRKNVLSIFSPFHLGFYHEQSRPDRDDFIDIYLHNVEAKMRFNFKKATEVNSLGNPYDYRSVMHYDKTAFGDGKITMMAKKTVTTRTSSVLDLVFPRVTSSNSTSCTAALHTTAPTLLNQPTDAMIKPATAEC